MIPLSGEAARPHSGYSPDVDRLPGRRLPLDDRELGLTDFHQESLLLRSWGMTTIPVGRDERSVGRWKHVQHRKPTDRAIGRWFEWASSRVRGIAVVHGRASGTRGRIHALRDFETMEQYRRWADGNRPLAADCPTVWSPGAAPTFTSSCAAPKRSSTTPDGSGELRADSGHYTLLPPSLHPNGLRYRWRDGAPVSPSDFPVVRWADTGFVPTAAAVGAVTRPDGRARPAKPQSHPNGLCPRVDITGLDDLPAGVREAVPKSQPNRPGERERRLLYLTRLLLDIDSAADPRRWVAAVRYWWTLAQPVVGTQDWIPTWRAFCRAWGRGERPMSQSRPLVVMAEAATAAGDDPETRLRAACRAKAADSPDGTFFLGCRTAAQVGAMGKSHAAKILARLCGAGFLEQVAEGARGARSRRAAVYRLGRSAAHHEDAK